MSGEVICPNCGRPGTVDAFFCTECGASLTTADGTDSGGPAEGSEESRALREELTSARRQLSEIGLLLNRLQERQAILERGPGAPAGPVVESTPSVAAAEPPPEALNPSEAATARMRAATAARAGAGVGASGALSASPPSGPGGSSVDDDAPRLPSFDWEQILGRNWFAIIGAIALVLGIGFFLKLAIDNNWIGDTGRIALGIGVGVALLGVGEYAQRRVPVWSQSVTAGGAAILYLSIYAAFGLYELILPEAAFLFLTLVVALAGLLALRYESIVIALLGIIGAFLAPILLGPDLADVRLLLAYILLVDLGILGVSTFRNWRWFTLLGLAGSYTLFIYALVVFEDYDAIQMQIGLTAVFLIFAGATTLFHLVWRRVPGPLDIALVGINAAAYFGLTAGILIEDYEDSLGVIAVALALFYGLIAYAAIKRTGAPPRLPLITLPVALVFLTIAVPLQLNGEWITVAWAAQGVVLVWTGFMLGRWQTRMFGLAALALSVARLGLFDLSVNLIDFTPIINERFPIFLAAIAAFYAAGYLYWRYRNLSQKWEEHFAPALFGVASLLTLGLLTLEIVDYFDGRILLQDSYIDRQWYLNYQQLSITALFTAYAFVLTAVGLSRRLQLARTAGLVLMGLAVFKLLMLDTGSVSLDPATFIAFLNVQFQTFALVLLALAGLTYWYWRVSPRLHEAETYVWQGLLVAVNLVGVWALSQEIIHYFGSLEDRAGGNYQDAMHLSLTVLWAVYSIGVIGAGIVIRSSRVRLAGMALLAIPVAKLFVFDVFLLEQGYRVAAFVTLGVLLLGMGLVYQRYNQAIRGFFFDRRD